MGASSPGGTGGAGFDPTPDVKDSDVTAFVNGFISIVPIEPDYTAEKHKKFESVVNGFEF